MDAFGQFLLDFLVIGGILGFLVILVSMLIAQHSKQTTLHQQHHEELEILKSELKSHQDLIHKLHKRFHLTEMSLTNNQQTISNIERHLMNKPSGVTNDKADDDVTYHFAMKLLKNGKTIEEVIQYCNLSEGEADVIKAMYQNTRTTMDES